MKNLIEYSEAEELVVTELVKNENQCNFLYRRDRSNVYKRTQRHLVEQNVKGNSVLIATSSHRAALEQLKSPTI